jgi:hypothetical protein
MRRNITFCFDHQDAKATTGFAGCRLGAVKTVNSALAGAVGDQTCPNWQFLMMRGSHCAGVSVDPGGAKRRKTSPHPAVRATFFPGGRRTVLDVVLNLHRSGLCYYPHVSCFFCDDFSLANSALVDGLIEWVFRDEPL